MTAALKISVGQHSDKGRKAVNQDFHGAASPTGAQRVSKGVAVALADGIGSSDVSQVASEFAVRGLLDDYYCTSDAWTVKKSVERVLAATNSWLHAKTRQGPHRFDQDRGYVCTLSALVFKSNTAHLFHVGDTRVYRVFPTSIEQLTQDHRVRVADGQSYLSRAVGFKPQLEIDYQALPLAPGDTFLLVSDGVYDHLDAAFITETVRHARGDLDGAARALVEEALHRGSEDNLTAQIAVVDTLPGADAAEGLLAGAALPPPSLLEPRAVLDGFTIVRKLHGSARSHLYLAVDDETGERVALKTLSVDQHADPAAIERFLLEEWIARRIDSVHVLKPHVPARPRRHLYVTLEYVEGRTLAQWLADHPRPDVEAVRGLVEQIARGLQAFHRLEMLHRDLRPENIMIDGAGTVKIVDFGATRVAGLAEMAGGDGDVPGSVQYTAPECFLGEVATFRSDLFSLGVITYQLLSGRLPYGTDVAKARTRSAQRHLRYDSVLADDREIPAWLDGVLRKAVSVDPLRRHESLSEFVHDLRHPNPTLMARGTPPLLERHPVRFWKGVSLVLALAVLGLLVKLNGA